MKKSYIGVGFRYAHGQVHQGWQEEVCGLPALITFDDCLCIGQEALRTMAMRKGFKKSGGLHLTLSELLSGNMFLNT